MSKVPVITFEHNDIFIGQIVKGESREVVFKFKNTGNAPLKIDLVTSCKCASIDFPRGEILPGEGGKIVVLYDTSTQDVGKVRKTIDIIANTDPIVVEAFFRTEILPKNKRG